MRIGGSGHACTHVRARIPPPVSSVLLLAPVCRVQRSARDRHLREERKRERERIERKENVRKENIQACYMFPPSASAHRGTQKAERDCHNGEKNKSER